MSKKEEYTTIQLEPKDEAQRVAILVLMQEGALREREHNITILQDLFNVAENAETRRLLTMAIARINGDDE